MDNLCTFVYKSPFSHRVASELHRISVTLASAFGFESRRYSDAKWRQLMLYHSAPPGYERRFFAVYRVEEEWRKRNLTNREIQSRPSTHIVSSLPPHKLHTNSIQAPHFVRFLLAVCCLYAVCVLPVCCLYAACTSVGLFKRIGPSISPIVRVFFLFLHNPRFRGRNAFRRRYLSVY